MPFFFEVCMEPKCDLLIHLVWKTGGGPRQPQRRDSKGSPIIHPIHISNENMEAEREIMKNAF